LAVPQPPEVKSWWRRPVSSPKKRAMPDGLSNGLVLAALDKLTNGLAAWIKGEAEREATAAATALLERAPEYEELPISAALWGRDPEYAAHLRTLGWAPLDGPEGAPVLTLRRPADRQQRLTKLRQEQQRHEELTAQLLRAEAVVSAFAAREGINADPLTRFVAFGEMERIDEVRLVLLKVSRQLSHKEVPDDWDNYLPAKGCRNNRITSAKQLRTLLDKLPNDAHGIRWRHRGQHLYVHAGDWCRWNAEQDRLEAEALDRSIPDVERVTAEIKAKKAARGAREK
jgi:hypothetical protein